MKSAKLSILVLTTLLGAGCGINSQSITDSKLANYIDGNSAIQPVKLSPADIARLDKEYSFQTQALTAAYFKRLIEQLIGNDNGVANGNKIIEQLEYARFKGESVVPFQVLSASDPAFYNKIVNIPAVIAARTSGSPLDI